MSNRPLVFVSVGMFYMLAANRTLTGQTKEIEFDAYGGIYIVKEKQGNQTERYTLGKCTSAWLIRQDVFRKVVQYSPEIYPESSLLHKHTCNFSYYIHVMFNDEDTGVESSFIVATNSEEDAWELCTRGNNDDLIKVDDVTSDGQYSAIRVDSQYVQYRKL